MADKLEWICKYKLENDCSFVNFLITHSLFSVVIAIVSELKEASLTTRARRGLSKALSSRYLLLYLPGSVVSAGSLPLLSSGERWLSAGERRQRLCTVVIVWRNTWRTWETQCRCREEEWEGTHLRGLIIFFLLTKVRLVFWGAF